MAKLSTHVLDTARGHPGQGVKVVLFRLDEQGARRQLAEATTNNDGRTDAPLLEGESLLAGMYELDFHVGDYFAFADKSFLDVVTVRFRARAGQSYHVPLLVSPYGYTTYRGS